MLKITQQDRKRYVLQEERDYKILEIIYILEGCKLSREDKKMLKLIRTQLEDDWRKPLLIFLEKFCKKYHVD